MKTLNILVLFFVLSTTSLWAQQKEVLSHVPTENLVLSMHAHPTQMEAMLDEEYKKDAPMEKVWMQFLNALSADGLEAKVAEKFGQDLFKSSKSGIDLSQMNLAAYMYKSSGDNMFINLLIPINKQSKLEAFMKKYLGADKYSKHSNEGGIKSLINKGTLISWDSKCLTLTSTSAKKSYYEEADEFARKRTGMLMTFKTDNAAALKKGTLSEDKTFALHAKEAGQMKVYMNYGVISEMLSEEQARSIPSEFRAIYKSMSGMASDMKLGALVNITNGKIDVKTKIYGLGKFGSLMKDATTKKLDSKILSYINGENLMFVYSMALDIETYAKGYWNIMNKELRSSKQGSLMADAMEIVSIFVDEEAIYGLITGQAAFAVTDFTQVKKMKSSHEYNEESDTWEEVKSEVTEPMPLGAFILGYKNHDDIMKFINLGLNAGMLVKNKEGVYTITPAKAELGMDVFVLLQNNLLILTNDEAIANAPKGLAAAKQIKGDVNAKMKANSQYMRIDFQEIIKTVKAVMVKEGKPVPNELKEMEKLMDFVEMRVAAISPEVTTMDFEFKMKDTKVNPLNVMMKYMGGMLKNSGSSSSSQPKSSTKTRKL